MTTEKPDCDVCGDTGSCPHCECPEDGFGGKPCAVCKDPDGLGACPADCAVARQHRAEDAADWAEDERIERQRGKWDGLPLDARAAGGRERAPQGLLQWEVQAIFSAELRLGDARMHAHVTWDTDAQQYTALAQSMMMPEEQSDGVLRLCADLATRDMGQFDSEGEAKKACQRFADEWTGAHRRGVKS